MHRSLPAQGGHLRHATPICSTKRTARLEAHPDKYVQKVYGEHELGGTQVLYLSHVAFEKLGFRFQQSESVPHLQQSVQHGVYKGFVAPVALYALLGAVIFRNRGKADERSQLMQTHAHALGGPLFTRAYCSCSDSARSESR